MTFKESVRRYKKIMRLFADGVSQAAIADVLGTSRQRINQIVHSGGPKEQDRKTARQRDLIMPGKNQSIYEQRIKEIPKGTRKHDVVMLIKQCAVDMAADGYSASRIGRMMKKDHSTILFHLGNLGKSKSAR